MLTVYTPLTAWMTVWEDLERAECPWARQMSDDDRSNFEQTIESMLQASIPDSLMTPLRQTWSKLNVDRPFSDNHPDVWWNLYVILSQKEHTTEEEALEVLTEILMSEDSTQATAVDRPGQASLALPFVKDLKYTGLCTAWRFTSLWTGFLTTLPAEVAKILRGELITLTMLVVLREMVH